MATMALKGEPDRAFAMAKRIAQFVNTLVDRPMQAAIVYGLNKKLHGQKLACSTPDYRWVAIRRSYEKPRGSLGSPRRGEEFRLAGLSRICNHEECICAEKIHEDIEQGCKDGPGLDVREQRE